MDFSVLMSVYKGDCPKYYSIALKSVTTKQSLKPKQVVIVYDGFVSNAIKSITLEEEKKNPNIQFTIVQLKKNQGLANALNKGLEKCKYEYVARMDSDDYSVSNRFKWQVEYLNKNRQIDVVGGKIAEFNRNPKKVSTIREVGLSHNDIVKMAKRRTPLNHVTVMYRKSKVLAVGGYKTDFGKLEDYRLWVDLISNGCIIANLNKILVHVRVGNGVLERRSDKREIKDWDNLQKLLLEAGIINIFESILNKIYIRVFVYMPIGLKKKAYNLVLRKRV